MTKTRMKVLTEQAIAALDALIDLLQIADDMAQIQKEQAGVADLKRANPLFCFNRVKAETEKFRLSTLFCKPGQSPYPDEFFDTLVKTTKSAVNVASDYAFYLKTQVSGNDPEEERLRNELERMDDRIYETEVALRRCVAVFAKAAS